VHGEHEYRAHDEDGEERFG
jgi:hypothetical protein